VRPGSSVVARLADDGPLGAPEADLAVVEWSHPGGGEPPLWISTPHIHFEDDEAWYVLEGVLRVRLGDDEVDVPAGGAVLAPRGIPHAYANATGGPARYLLVTTPRVLALVEALHTPGAGDPDPIFRAHRSELLQSDTRE
jgi:mannose-6-phosphate isomerase-like protein (cupin superfamily)